MLPAMKPRIDMGVCRVVRVSDDLAVVHHDFRCALTGPDGNALEITGKATEIVRRQPDGSWRFLLDDPHMRD
jgi:ketosteroid isomerase-like protein